MSDPGNLVQGIVNSVNEIVETSETAQNALSTWKETSKIFEQGREYYDKLRKVNDLISGSEKVKESVLMLGDISEIYVNNFGKMLTDKNFSQRFLFVGQSEQGLYGVKLVNILSLIQQNLTIGIVDNGVFDNGT